MSTPFAIDLQLTTLEFEGLVHALRFYTQHVGQQSGCQMGESEMILFRYAAAITGPRLIVWKKRRLSENRRNLSMLDRPRYTYRADWLLVRVLYRMMIREQQLRHPACSALLGRFFQLITGITSTTALQRGIVEAPPVPGPIAVAAGSGSLTDWGVVESGH